MKQDNDALREIINSIRNGEAGTVTYYYADGTLSSQPINAAVFIGNTNDTVLKVFRDTASDRGALYFTIN